METVNVSHLSPLEQKLIYDIANGAADVQPDNDGQLIIYTGLARLESGEIVVFDPEDGEWLNG